MNGKFKLATCLLAFLVIMVPSFGLEYFKLTGTLVRQQNAPDPLDIVQYAGNEYNLTFTAMNEAPFTMHIDEVRAIWGTMEFKEPIDLNVTPEGSFHHSFKTGWLTPQVLNESQAKGEKEWNVSIGFFRDGYFLKEAYLAKTPIDPGIVPMNTTGRSYAIDFITAENAAISNVQHYDWSRLSITRS